MWPYFVLIFLPALIPLINKKPFTIRTEKWKNDNAMKLFWFLLFLLLILRSYDVGTDIRNYKNIFELISKNNWQWAAYRSSEYGWNLLNKAVSCITSNFRWILVISAWLPIMLLNRYYSKYSTDTVLTIALFINISCFVLMFSGLRQSISISLGLLAFECVMQKKKWSFVLCVAVAMTFHFSAFMLLLLYPACNVRVKKSWLYWVIPVLILIYVFNQPIFNFLGVLLASFTKYDAQIRLTGSYTMLILLLLFAVFSFVIPDEQLMDNETIAMRNLLLISVALQMFAPLHSLAMRMNYYFLIFLPVLIPRVIKYRRKRFSQIAILSRYFLVVFFIGYFLIDAPKDNALATFPYQFFWEQ